MTRATMGNVFILSAILVGTNIYNGYIISCLGLYWISKQFEIKILTMKENAVNFTNAQLELLKAFSHNLNTEDLKRLKAKLAEYFAERLMDKVDEQWEKDDWNKY